MKLVKRDGSISVFDKGKIEEAVLKAMKNGSGIYLVDVAKQIADDAEDHFTKEGKEPTIYKIETYVYDRLVHYGQSLTAKAYEGYRAVQEFKRNTNTTDESILSLLNKTNEDVMKENSNKNSVIAATQRDLIAGEVSKDISRRRLIDSHLVQAHDEGVFHWHDMDYTLSNIFNCCLINLEDMLNNGTVINDKLVESPKSFSTACTVTTQIMAQVASNQYGGQSITIKHLAKFLKLTEEKYYKLFKESCSDDELARNLAKDMKLKELKDGIQTIRYQLSTLQTTNGQIGCLC
ncbi:anaerobic ribonucleoside-triphosphate reductase [Clostridium sp.]|uniref:anaerobic ribonucleoside-triphosphate reductase n=1 Tax=Clostridium sp. TaxID=1506 RepID=UPI0034533472